MSLRLNTRRTFTKPVNVEWLDDNGKTQKGSFGATFKIVPNSDLSDDNNSEKRLLDLVLVSVNESELELVDENDKVLTGDALLEAAKSDPTLVTALQDAYFSGVAKKGRNRT